MWRSWSAPASAASAQISAATWASRRTPPLPPPNDWQTNKAAVKAGQKQSKVKELFKDLRRYLYPPDPGRVASGLCAGINSLIGQVVPNYADIPALALISTLLGLMNTCFLGYLTAWVGYRAAESSAAPPFWAACWA